MDVNKMHRNNLEKCWFAKKQPAGKISTAGILAINEKGEI